MHGTITVPKNIIKNCINPWVNIVAYFSGVILNIHALHCVDERITPIKVGMM